LQGGDCTSLLFIHNHGIPPGADSTKPIKMQAKEAASGRGRAPAGDRKTLEGRRRERRLSADRRKSGPKATDVESMRQDGKAGRRRLSDNNRRTSKGNK
ncbi:unnamed protein product, partial [Ectocarpus sp. 13 AM-2016]